MRIVIKKLNLCLLVLTILFSLGCGGINIDGDIFGDGANDVKQRVRKNPNDVDARYSLGRSYLDQKQYQKAIAEFKEAIRMSPSFAAAHVELGSIYFYQKQYEKAIAEFKEAIQIKPSFAEAHHNLGSAYSELGHKDQAMEEYKEAIRINPDISEAHRSLGDAYFNYNQYPKSIASYKETIRINPDNVFANLGLGQLYLIQGKLNVALAHLKEADRIMPNDPYILAYIGKVYLEQDDPKKSIEILKKALNKNPASSKLDIIEDDTISELVTVIYGDLSDAYEKLKRYDDAIKTAKKATEIEYDNPTANLILGLSYDGKGDGQNAISHMIIAVKGFEESQTAYKHQVGLNKRIIQKSWAISKKKLREFYSKYDYNPEDFGDDGIATAPSIPRLAKPHHLKNKHPNQEQDQASLSPKWVT